MGSKCDDEFEERAFFLRLCEAVGSEKFQGSVMDFIESNYSLVRIEDEQNHEIWETYKQFQKLIEGLLSHFLESEGISGQDFYNRCKQARASGKWGIVEFMDELLAASEPEAFIEMLKQKKRVI